ncbi:MAG: histidinol dehydrogenase [Deltaproteobacteria bacterium]|jgi:histidinol dehydrogenase|nr:histidinol dehydrogenase [Deltaproteobacteria bacterium]
MLVIEFLKTLALERKNQILRRSMASFSETLESTKEILNRLRKDPYNELLREYSPLKDGLKIDDFLVSKEEIDSAFKEVEELLIDSLKIAASNIMKFHVEQLERKIWFTEISPGLIAGRITRPINSVGVYVPGGRAPYPSTALMNIIPAVAAGVKKIVAVSPPGPGFKIRPEILVALKLSGANAIYKLGGAWAIGSLAYGLLDFPKVQKIVGPGSSWVTAAKMSVFGEVDIDLPAGPSEGFIIADESADAQSVAWDFLAQLEHDPQAAAILVTTSPKLAERVLELINEHVPKLSRTEIVKSSMANAAVLVSDTIDEAINFSNEYAPEHLELIISEPLSKLGQIESAGSIFLGPYSPIAAGDYASGPNHVLPTGGTAAYFSGLSTDSFLKKMTFQNLTKEALKELCPVVVTLADAEGLECHAKSLKIRLS